MNKIKFSLLTLIGLLCCSFTNEVTVGSVFDVKNTIITLKSYKQNDNKPKGFARVTYDVKKIIPEGTSDDRFFVIVNASATAVSGTAANNLTGSNTYENNWLTHYFGVQIYLEPKTSSYHPYSYFRGAGNTTNSQYYNIQESNVSSFQNTTANTFGITLGGGKWKINGSNTNTLSNGYSYTFQRSYTIQEPTLTDGQLDSNIGYSWYFNFDWSKNECRNSFNANLALIFLVIPFSNNYPISNYDLGLRLKTRIRMDCHKDWFSGNTNSDTTYTLIS